MIGKKFGKITVLSLSHKNPKNRTLYWNCVCDCGKSVIKTTADFKRSFSCGCSRKGSKPGNIKQQGEANINSLYGSYKKTAKQRNILFQIDIIEFKKLIKKNCTYCGIEPLQIHRKNETNGELKYNGIDRIDSNLGYVSNNLTTCCKTCNYAKRKMSLKEFYFWIEKVYNTYKESKC